MVDPSKNDGLGSRVGHITA